MIFKAVCELVPREDRVRERRVFQGFGGDRVRTALTCACTVAGQRNLAVTANTYSHVLADEAELDYAGLLGD